jgi:uncharacterized cupin superfamily protein
VSPDVPASDGQLIRPTALALAPYDLTSRDVETGEGLRCEVALAWNSPNGLRFGISRFTPGRMSFVSKVDEVLVPRSGRIRITIDGGTPLEPAPGDAVYFAAGQRVEYEVLEDFEEWFWILEAPADA